MRFALYYTHKEFQRRVADSFLKGFGAELIYKPDYDGADYDVSAVVGLMPDSQRVFNDCLAKGKQVLLLDKPYYRHMIEHVRVSTNGFQPHKWLMSAKMPQDRLRSFGVKVKDAPPQSWRRGSILIAGSSQKFCTWHGLGDATEYAQRLVDEIRRWTNRPIIYRPKPSFKAAVPVKGASFSHMSETGQKRRFVDDLVKADLVVTFGSNAALEALAYAIPVVVLGPGIGMTMASRTIEEGVKTKFIPSWEERKQYLANVAYCQWDIAEIEAGVARPYILKQLETCQ
jgi:hypothetical protein